MREIKFRAWDKKAKHIWDVISLAHPTESGFDTIGIQADEVETWLEGDEFVLMQYTGLKDKNDVDIFEGDVVKIYPHVADKGGSPTINIVEWSELDACYMGIYSKDRYMVST